jgi:hypothetical protein
MVAKSFNEPRELRRGLLRNGNSGGGSVESGKMRGENQEQLSLPCSGNGLTGVVECMADPAQVQERLKG